MSYKSLVPTILVAAALLFPAISHAQYGMGGMGGMGMGGMGYGGGGFGGGGFGGGGIDGPGAVTVKYGEKIYCAMFGDLIDYKVYYIQVPADAIGVHYFDDGTMGDEVSYDGMPSNINVIRDQYLGPFAIKYKHWISKAVDKAEDMGALSFYNLGVATDDPESKVASLEDWRGTLENQLVDVRATVAQFEGYDDTTYIKSIDPSLFESLEGFGGLNSGFGAGGFLPDLPPPPGLPQPGDQFRVDDGTDAADTEDSGAYNPVQNTRDAVGGLGGAPSLGAVEAMNSLN
ncbi:MAG: hypothetical protein P9L94_13330 [Candidatus Hinthialibacter antarcticus]|nr:hypothetical protein [Candidatus Hinthialibacter antarcticus]